MLWLCSLPVNSNLVPSSFCKSKHHTNSDQYKKRIVRNQIMKLIMEREQNKAHSRKKIP